jgi:hypothetical protein
MDMPGLGVIEGYFGRPWDMAARKAVITRLKPYGYGFFHYAPKADAFLRRRWREPYPDAGALDLAALAAHARANGVRFGVGLSPFELHLDLNGAAREAFRAKVRALTAIGLDDLAILFDDMRGDIPELAARQAEIVDLALAETTATRVFACPSYYSDDAVLDTVFGARPSGYLEEFGRRIDPSVAIYWTGPEVCTLEFSPGHLARVGEALRRKPVLWDNYPVNDGPRMSQFLHLRGFTGRPATIAPHVAAHAVNPALQPFLTLLPAATLAASYRDGADYDYMRAFAAAAHDLAGPEMAALLCRDFFALHLSRERLGDAAVRLKGRFGPLPHPMAQEIVRWIDGGYTMERWEIETG